MQSAQIPDTLFVFPGEIVYLSQAVRSFKPGQADLTNYKSGRDHKHLRKMGFFSRSKLTIASLFVFYCLNTTSGTQIGFSRPCTQDITVTQQSIRTYLLIACALHKIYYAKLYLVFLQPAWQPVSWNNVIFTLK